MSTEQLGSYPLIRLWGAMMGSHAPYVRDQVDAAKREHAPQTAIYRRTVEQIPAGDEARYFRVAGSDGAWALWTADIPADTRVQILREAKRADLDVAAVVALMDAGYQA